MADWTAITGIVVSGVVGPAVGAFAGFKRGQQEHRQAIVLGDRSELRALLDDAEQEIMKAGRHAGAMPGLFLTHGRYTAERAKAHVDDLRESLKKADLYCGRLALRLGEGHGVTTAYREAFEALVRVVDAVHFAWVSGEHANLRETAEVLKQGNDQFLDAHDRFLTDARGLVASQTA